MSLVDSRCGLQPANQYVRYHFASTQNGTNELMAGLFGGVFGRAVLTRHFHQGALHSARTFIASGCRLQLVAKV